MFGEGNVESTVLLFETQHKCNRFCEWPGFGLKKFGRKQENEAPVTGTSVDSRTC